MHTLDDDRTGQKTPETKRLWSGPLFVILAQWFGGLDQTNCVSSHDHRILSGLAIFLIASVHCQACGKDPRANGIPLPSLDF